jgi:hypothetical protein
MLGRASGGRAFVPQSPAPKPCSSLPTYHLPTNTLPFQQIFRFKKLSTFVFIDIPASAPSFPQRSFVFNNIPASFRQKTSPFSWLVGFLELQDRLSE